MTGLILIAAAHLVGIGTNDCSAVYFGEEGCGAFVPYGLSELRIAEGMSDAERRESLAGVKTIVVEDWVTAVPDGLFSGIDSLESVTIGKTVVRLGARAFADCPRLNCVVFRCRGAVESADDAFDGAGPRLTAVYPSGASVSARNDARVLRPKRLWQYMTALDYTSGDNSSEGRLFVSENLCLYRKASANAAQIVRLLSLDDPAVIPSTVDGLEVVDVGDSAIPSNSDAEGVVIDSGRFARFGVRNRPDIKMCLIRGSVPQSFYPGAKMRVYATGSAPAWRGVTCVPDWVDYETLKSLTNGIPVVDGYQYLPRNGGASILGRANRSHPQGREVVLPSSLGGLPVTELAPGLLSGCRDVEKIVLPPALRTIPEGLCFGCPNLRCVVVGTNVVSVGRFAFVACPKLDRPVFAPTVEVSEWAFDESVRKLPGGRVLLQPPD